ncbi:MAG: hypothetical protein IKZ99_07555 [Salinivirgaceae bacterium]|nr:hypothetical protein [Salinivirgaceae bacterium]
MDFIGHGMLIGLLYAAFLAVSAVIIVVLIIRRIRIKKTETFEKRND